MADVSKINLDGTLLNIKDATARTDIQAVKTKEVLKAEYATSTETITI